jgi:hypothetical protein
MSDAVHERIAVLQHGRKQREAYNDLTSISNKLGEKNHAPIDPGLSFRIQVEMYEKLKAMRVSAALHAARYTLVDDAVDGFLVHVSTLSSDAVGEFYTGENGSGFFVGPFSRPFLLSCLAECCEGFALVQTDLASGALLDVAFDDPLCGNFYEVEWW